MATRASPSGTSSAARSTRPTAPPSGTSSALLDVEPFLHPARGVPHLALRDVGEEVAGADRAVVAPPPDAELELAAVVGLQRVLEAGVSLVGHDDHVRRGRRRVLLRQ